MKTIVARVILGIVLIGAVAGLMWERGLASFAYTVSAVNSTPTSFNVVYGNWDQVEYVLTANLGTNNAETGLTWAVSDLPKNTSARFANESVDTGTLIATTTMVLKQDPDTSGPDVENYTFTVTATGSDFSTETINLGLNVEKRPVTITGNFTVETKTYDREPSATIATNTLSLEQFGNNPDRGALTRDNIGLIAVATFTNVNAGNQAVNLLQSTLQGGDRDNYLLEFTNAPTATGTIAKKGVTVSGLTFTKVYDGTLPISASGTASVSSGVVSGDTTPTVTATPTFALNDPNVGSGKTVSIASGAFTLNNANYEVSTTSFDTAEVTPATLTVNFSVSSRAYDGSTDVTDQVALTGFTGLAARDSAVTASFTSASASDASVGTRTVTLTGLTLSTAEARANYTVQGQAARTIEITKKALTLDGSFSATSRAYNGTTTATGDTSGLSLVGVISPDVVTISGVTLAFSQADASSIALPVTITGVTLSAGAGDNYEVTLPSNITSSATISRLTLTFTLQATQKVYDGTTDAAVTCTPTNVPAGEAATIAVDCRDAVFSGSGDWTGVAETITVTPVITVNGTAIDASGNYQLANATETLTQIIAKRPLTILGLDAVDREYNGETSVDPTGTLTLDDVIAADINNVGIDSSAASLQVASPNASASAKAVTVTGYTLTGNRAFNYDLSQPTGVTVAISKKVLVVQHTRSDKVYDGTDDARGVISLSLPGVSEGGVLAADTAAVAVQLATATFDDPGIEGELARDVGVNKAITVSGLSLVTPAGQDATVKDNYVLQDSGFSTTGTITRAPLTLTSPSKQYDGSKTTAARFDVDSGPNPRFRRTVNEAFDGDYVTVIVSGTFVSEFVHTGTFTYTNAERDAILSGTGVSGRDAKNYQLILPGTQNGDGNWETTGSITTRIVSLTGISVASSKVYDATRNAIGMVTLNNPDISGRQSRGGVTDTVTLNLANAAYTFDSEFVGNDIMVRGSGITLTGADQGGDSSPEYQISSASLRWERNITPRTVTIILTQDGTFTAQSRPYDGGVVTNKIDVTGLVLDNLPIAETSPPSLSIDRLEFMAGNSLRAKDVDTGKTVKIAAASLSQTNFGGSSAAEYILNIQNAPTTTADITKKALTRSDLSITISNRVYNADVNATVSQASVTTPGRVTGDTLTVSVDAEFVTKNAETNKAVNLSNITLGGADALNYSIDASFTNFATTATVSKKGLTVTGITSPGKVYDRSTAAPKRAADGAACVRDQGETCVVDDLGATLVGVEPLTGTADDVTLVRTNGSFVFNNQDQSPTRTLTGSGYVLDGADKGNYTLTQPVLSNITIAPRPVTAVAAAKNGGTRPYDGTRDASDVVELSLTGIIAGDEAVTVSATSITFDDPNGRNVGDNKAVTASGLSLSESDSTIRDNYTLNGQTTATLTGTTGISVTAFTLTVIPEADDKTYDGNNTAQASCTINPFTISGDTDDVEIDCSNATFPAKDVVRNPLNTGLAIEQTVTITSITLSGNDAPNYALPFQQTTTLATINPQPLTASGFTPLDKTYDGLRGATFDISNATLVGFVGNDSFIFTAVGGIFATDQVQYVNNNVADGVAKQKVRLNSWTFSGATAAIYNNYTINLDTSETEAKINPRPLPITLVAADKIYDRNPSATVTPSFALNDLVSDDRSPLANGLPTKVTVSATGTFGDPNVGDDKTVTSSVTLAGTRAKNYVAEFTHPTADITKRPLVWTVNATSRPYDGTTNVVYTLSDNRVSGDTFTINAGTGSFATPTRGNGKTVTVTGISIADGGSANYTAPSIATGTANITFRTITVTGTFTAANKVYDGNTTATVTSTTNLVLGNIATGDSFTIATTSATFNTRDVADAKTVTLNGLTISGANSSNYQINVSGVSTTTANITPLELTPTIVVANKRWDGTTAATVSSITVTQISGDEVTASAASAEFASADQGTGITVSVSGISLGGTHAANYTISPTATTTANITGQGLTISISAQNKVYDGTRDAAVTLSDNRDIGDNITITHSPAQFTTSGAGNGITVTIINIVISGPDADRYVLANAGGVATTTANITQKPLGITAQSKVYDQTDAATVALDGVVAGDTVTFTTTSATFDDKNVGSGKTVTAQGLTLGGSGAGNYSINSQETTTADITPKVLLLTFVPNPPVSDAASGITVTITDDRITGDDLTVTITDASTVRRGNQLVLVITDVTVTGADGLNYSTAGSFEIVIRVFPAPDRPRPTADQLAGETIAAAPPVTRPGTRPPGATPPNVATPAPPRPTAPAPAGSSATPGTTAGVPDILPGWRPPANPRATIDFGSGVVSRQVDPRQIAEDIAVQAPQEVAAEQFGGFAPGATTQLEIMGARTISRIFVPQSGSASVEQLQQSLQSVTLDISPESPRLFPTATASGFDVPTAQEIDLLQDALAWLGLPEATRGPGLAPGSAIGEVVWQVEGFRPGSAVFLVATSEPSLVAWGIARDDGSASLRGYILDNTLPPGEHRFRVVGTAVLGDVSADQTGAATIGRDLNQYLGIFDEDTRVSVALWGENTDGADHVAVRYIDPSISLPGPLWWWLLLPAALWLMFVLWRRRTGRWNEPGPTAGATAIGGVLIAPAVIVGVTVTDQQALVPWGIAVAIVVAVGLVFGRRRSTTLVMARRKTRRDNLPSAQTA